MANKTVFAIDEIGDIRDQFREIVETGSYQLELFASATDFFASYDGQQEGCVVADAQLSSITPIELLDEMVGRRIYLPVIFLSEPEAFRLAIEAIKAGAFDVMMKPVPSEELLDRIKQALVSSNTAYADRLLRAALERRIAELTRREREVLTLVAAGDTCKMIARSLGISYRTVEAHRARIIRKLQARGPGDLVRLAAIIRLLPPR